ncbi:hypothetical protein TKK_0006245 [Trichogramma kaykai]|uniref:Peptidase M12B domain-containing protein n=1 Tax=Trichogramma kaykai TaxID=54128 RepID=A0ABD2XDZ8_9HYME
MTTVDLDVRGITPESSEPEEQPDPLDKLSRLVPFIETHEFNYTQYLQEPEEERVLIGTNTPLYIAKYDEETEKIKYRAYHYPEPQPINSCGNKQHQKLLPKKHIESEKTSDENEDIVYPQILVVVDHSIYKKYGGNVFKIAQIVAAYWNSVDLLYRTIKSPKIRLNIAGLIIPESPEAIPYVEKNYNHDLGSIDTSKMENDMVNYFAENSEHLDGIPEDSFDVAFLMTNRLNAPNFLGTAVGDVTYTTVSWGTGDFEHNSDSVNTGAHELAHLLKADHDWEKGCLRSPNIMGNPEGKSAFAWSQCSLRDMIEFVNKPENQFLRNRPNIGKPHPRILQGRYSTRDHQCQSLGGKLQNYFNLDPTYFSHVPREYEQDCSVLFCASRNAETDYEAEEKETKQPPLDGTSCGCGKICFQGKCVDDQE